MIRRRTALIRAGLEHGALAKAIEKLDGIGTSRQTVTSVINGHFPSMGGRVERRIVELTRQRLVELGKTDDADGVTLDAFGWGHIEHDTAAHGPGGARATG